MSTPPKEPEPEQIHAACKALAARFDRSMAYAVLGGAACQLLGSTRATEDVDFVVPQYQKEPRDRNCQ